MNEYEWLSLKSEQGQLRRMVADSSPGNLFGMISFERRLSKVEARLERYAGWSPEPDVVGTDQRADAGPVDPATGGCR